MLRVPKDDWSEWVFVTPENGVVDAGTTAPLGSEDICYAFSACWEDAQLHVNVVTFDDNVSTDTCEPGSTSCWAWDDDAVEVFLDGAFARLPDSRADGGVHLKHGGEFSLVANGAAMSDFSGYPKTFVKPDDPVTDPDNPESAEKVWWTGRVLTGTKRERLSSEASCPAGFAPNGTTETEYVFHFPWAAMGRTNAPERIGLNIGVQDDDGGGRRNHALYWTGNPARPFSDESAFGILKFDD